MDRHTNILTVNVLVSHGIRLSVWRGDHEQTCSVWIHLENVQSSKLR